MLQQQAALAQKSSLNSCLEDSLAANIQLLANLNQKALLNNLLAPPKSTRTLPRVLQTSRRLTLNL
jgi:hypothetical protein